MRHWFGFAALPPILAALYRAKFHQVTHAFLFEIETGNTVGLEWDLIEKMIKIYEKNWLEQRRRIENRIEQKIENRIEQKIENRIE